MQFYVLDLRNLYGRGGFANFDMLDPVEVGEAPRCPHCGAMIAPLPWGPPHRVELTRGTMADAIFGPSEEFFISARFGEALDEAGLIGFDEVANVGEGPPFDQRYRLVRPKLRFVRIDESRVQWRGEAPCGVCRIRSWRAVSGVVVDETTWDGTDLFTTPSFTGRIIASQRLQDLVLARGFTNFELVRADQYEESFQR